MYELTLEDWINRQTLSNFIPCEFTFIMATSLEEATFISRFCFWTKMHYSNTRCKDGFFIIEKEFCIRVGIKPATFRRLIRKWEKLGLFEVTRKGCPPRKHYQLNENFAKYLNLLNKFGQYCIDIMEKEKCTEPVITQLRTYKKRVLKVNVSDLEKLVNSIVTNHKKPID
jgi:DNA-binding PadR family transcriptional regulator